MTHDPNRVTRYLISYSPDLNITQRDNARQSAGQVWVALGQRGVIAVGQVQPKRCIRAKISPRTQGAVHRQGGFLRHQPFTTAARQRLGQFARHQAQGFHKLGPQNLAVADLGIGDQHCISSLQHIRQTAKGPFYA